MFQWIKEKINPSSRPNKVNVEPQKIIEEPPRQSDHSRMNGYIDFRVSDTISNFITVDEKRLYFEPFNSLETVQTFQDQFTKFTGRPLTLSNQQIQISPTMPLSQILDSSEAREIFEDILQKIESKAEVSMVQVPPQKRQSFQKIIKACSVNYDAKVSMEIGPGGRIEKRMKIDGETTFNKIVDQLCENPHIVGKEDIQFRSQSAKFERNCYQKPFRDLNIRQSNIYADYTNRNSYIRGNTKVAVGSKHIQTTMLQLRSSSKTEVISYDSIGRRFKVNRVQKFQQTVTNRFLRISLTFQNDKQKQETTILECTASVRIMGITEEFDQIWIPAGKLRKDDKVGGINSRENSFVIYRVAQVEEIQTEKSETFYGLEVMPSHQYIANNIIVHNNNDKFRITACYINGEHKKEEEITFERHQPISQYFGDKICQVGGLVLKNNQTFGDYQLEKLRIIYVYENSENINQRREYTISEWKKDTVTYDSVSQDYKKKLKQGYLGIYNERVISPHEIDLVYQAEGHKNVLVGIRTYLQKLNYIINKEPLYHQLQSASCGAQWVKKGNDKNLQKMLKRVQKDLGVITKDDLLAIYLYTSNDIFSDLNKFLRDQYIRDTIEQEKKFLPLAGWIYKSCKKTALFRGVAYRGIKNIDIEKAFRLNREQIARDKFIVFTSFSSSSKKKDQAMKFQENHKSSLLLTLKLQNGRYIQHYSAFPQEQEVIILPFTYFAINKYDAQTSHQTAELEQIPMPQTNFKNIIFWVDDKPENNDPTIKEHFQNIEVVQVTSTRIMKIILKEFFCNFKMLGKKVVIISDMVRWEDGVENKFAGVDLFEHIYKEYGLSNRAIIYAGDKGKAKKNLIDRGIKPGNWVVVVDQGDLVRQVLSEFEKM